LKNLIKKITERPPNDEEISTNLIISISPRKIIQGLGLAILFLIIAHVFVTLYRLLLGRALFGLVWRFDLMSDKSVPTWYASVTLLICFVLLLMISLAKRKVGDRYTHHWEVLSAIFLFLSLDETATIHEWSGNLVSKAFQTSDFLNYPWVIFGVIFVIILVPAYLKFFLDLPAKIKWLFFISGTIYVGGGIGVEMINARHESLHGWENLTYSMMTALEESLEMAGVAIFIYALLLYLRSNVKEVQICIK